MTARVVFLAPRCSGEPNFEVEVAPAAEAALRAEMRVAISYISTLEGQARSLSNRRASQNLNMLKKIFQRLQHLSDAVGRRARLEHRSPLTVEN